MRSKKINRILNIAKIFKRQIEILAKENSRDITLVEQELLSEVSNYDPKVLQIIYGSRGELFLQLKQLQQRQERIHEALIERDKEVRKFEVLLNKAIKKEKTILERKESKDIEERIILSSYEEK